MYVFTDCRMSNEALKTLVDYSINSKTLCVVGTPLAIDGNLYEVAVAFSSGKVVGVFRNTAYYIVNGAIQRIAYGNDVGKLD